MRVETGKRSPVVRMVLVAALVAGLLTTVSTRATGAPGPAGPGCHPAWPVVAHRAGGDIVRLPPATRPTACATRTGYATSESTIAVTSAGTLVYSPAQTENSVARSTDQGATWSLTYPADEQYTSFWNTTDPDLITDRRTGRVFWAHATGPVRTEGTLPFGLGFWLAAAYGFQVYTSRDDARTFTTADYSTAPTGDWEKVFVGPAPAGFVRPTGYPDVVYLCANSPLEVTGPGRLCYKSLDGGATFAIAGYVSPSPSQPPDVCAPLNFSTGVVDSQGTIFQPAACLRGAYLTVSHDEGASYTWLPVKDAPSSPPFGGNTLQVAVDDADNLYAAWTAAGALMMERSTDHGRSWSPPFSVAGPGLHHVTLPAAAAGARGRLGFTYYASTSPTASTLTAYITQTNNALDAQPLFYTGAINDPAQPIFRDFGVTGPSPRADFVSLAYDRAGTTAWAGVVQQLGPADANNHIPTSGYVGRLTFPR